MRHPLPPCAADGPALLDASRWRQSAGPNRSDADHRPRSRSSASCSFTILPNSFGLPALPLRMISVDGSNTLRILPSACVSPRKTRALVCFITCLTSGTIASSSWRKPSSASCCRTFLARFVPPAISLEPLCLSYHSAGRIEQLAIGSMEPVPAFVCPGG